MPAEGLDWLPDESVLTDDEIVRLIHIGVQLLGIREVRFTGGEPLVRRGLVDIVARHPRGSRRDLEISMTTNALGLARTAHALRPAGLDRVNVSLDTVRPETFHAITRRDRLARRGRRAWPPPRTPGSVRSRSTPCCCAGINDDEAPELLRWCLDRGYELRFIEQMPLDAQHGWSRDGDDHRRRDPRQRWRRSSCSARPTEPRGSAPAELFLVDGGPATVGVIASVTRPFCGDCDRVRLTADGQVRNCLFAREESDLRAALRAGATDEEIADRWVAAMATKRAGHGIDDPTFLQPDRPMSAIGG